VTQCSCMRMLKVDLAIRLGFQGCGVALLPHSSSCKVVSGAMDYSVQLHEIGEGRSVYLGDWVNGLGVGVVGGCVAWRTQCSWVWMLKVSCTTRLCVSGL
jgi:hypothetical protein